MTVTVTQANGVGQPILGGIALMLLGVFLMTGMDVAAKWLLDTYSLSQLVFLRCAVSMLVIGLFVLIRGDLRALHTRRDDDPGDVFFFLRASSDATRKRRDHRVCCAGNRHGTFRSTAGRTRRHLALVGSCCRVYRGHCRCAASAGADRLRGVARRIATFMWAGLSLTARKLSASEPTAALSLYLFPLPMLIGAFGSTDSWVTPTWQAWLLFATCGIFGGLAFVAINAAFRRAPATVIVPFEYTGLIWAIVAGVLFWQELPDTSTLVGAAVIITSGLVILYRETRTMSREGVQSDFALQDVVPAEDDR